MSIKNDSYIKYPYEYIAAQVEFGARVAAVTKQETCKTFKKYTDLYGTLTNHKFADDKKNLWVKTVLEDLENILRSRKGLSAKTDDIYQLYLSIPLEKPVSSKKSKKCQNDEICFGCFKLNNSELYRSKNEVRLHFIPLRKGLDAKQKHLRTSDLAPVYIEERQREFSQMINYIYENPDQFKDTTHFVSSTWLQNLPVYRSFFPENDRINRTRVPWGYLWLWGQFLKWDMTGNEKRLEAFRQNLKEATTLEEVINAIPLQVYEIKVPIEDMLAMYVPGYVANEEMPAEMKSFNETVHLRFDTNRLLRSGTEYLSEE